MSLSDVEQIEIGLDSSVVFYLVIESSTHKDTHMAKGSLQSFIHTDCTSRKQLVFARGLLRNGAVKHTQSV